MHPLLYLLLFIWGLSIFLTFDFARQKGRNKFLWLALSIPFGFVALYALLRACAGNPVFGYDPDGMTIVPAVSPEEVDIDGGETTSDASMVSGEETPED